MNAKTLQRAVIHLSVGAPSKQRIFKGFLLPMFARHQQGIRKVIGILRLYHNLCIKSAIGLF